MEGLIKEINRMRDAEVEYQKKCKCEDDNNKEVYFYMEGRISALSDILLQYYYHFKDKGGNGKWIPS